MYTKMCAAIHHAIDTTLPDCQKRNGIKRKVSDRTKRLFEERQKLCGQGNKEEFDNVQGQIKASSLEDFEDWVGEWATVIGQADSKGDTKGIYKGVKALANKREKPPANLTVDANGDTLKCAEDVASTWHAFLSNKFAATDAEERRPPVDTLPCTMGVSDLTDEQFNEGLRKMGKNKACGIDGISADLYKKVPICGKLLRELLQKIWSEEDVPPELAKAKFIMLFKNKARMP